MTNATHEAPAALWWPQNLYYVNVHNLDCYLDLEPPDDTTGYNGNAWLVHAYAGGVDITELLSDHIIRDIETYALQKMVASE
jgi:hypothetical protein